MISFTSELENGKKEMLEIDNKSIGDLKKYLNRDYILEHISIMLKKASDQPMAKRYYKEFPGLEGCLYLKEEREDGSTVSLSFDKVMLPAAGILEKEAWKRAEQNVRRDLVIDDLGSIVSQAFGIDVSEDEDEYIKLYVVTNRCCYKGASGVLDREIMEKFARGHNCRQVMVIPSSVHEMLLLPHAERFDEDDISRIIKQVNAESVDPKDQLGDRPFILEF